MIKRAVEVLSNLRGIPNTQPVQCILNCKIEAVSCALHYHKLRLGIECRSALKTLQVGRASSWECRECLVVLASPPSHAANPSRGHTAYGVDAYLESTPLELSLLLRYS